VKFAIACVMLLVFFRPSAAASDDRELASDPLAELGSASVPASKVLLTISVPATTATALPNAPMAIDLTTAGAAPANAFLATPAALITLKAAPRPHRFFDARNSLALACLAASLSADALSTQKGLAYPSFREINPIARPFVQTRTGAAIYTAGSFALLAGVMYVAHKTGHHKLERIFPFAIAGWEGLLSARNYHEIAANTR
jgi:hypothetical protein